MKVIGFMWHPTPLVLSGLQLLIFQMFFDRMKHNTSLLHKIRFYCIYGKMFFLIESFLSSRRVESWVVKCKPYCECVTNSGMHQIFILIHFFFYFNCLPDNVLCKIAIWADDTALNSPCDKPSDLSHQAEL